MGTTRNSRAGFINHKNGRQLGKLPAGVLGRGGFYLFAILYSIDKNDTLLSNENEFFRFLKSARF